MSPPQSNPIDRRDAARARGPEPPERDLTIRGGEVHGRSGPPAGAQPRGPGGDAPDPAGRAGPDPPSGSPLRGPRDGLEPAVPDHRVDRPGGVEPLAVGDPSAP